jgi:hypothetical protein
MFFRNCLVVALLSVCFINQIQSATVPTKPKPPVKPAVAVQPAQPQGPIVLKRVFTPGKTNRFRIVLHIKGDFQTPTVETMFPVKQVLERIINIKTSSITPDGTADVTFDYETYKIKTSEFFDSPSKTFNVDVGEPIDIILSPLNVIIAVKKERLPKNRQHSITNFDEMLLLGNHSQKREVYQSLGGGIVVDSMMELVKFERLLDFGPQYPPTPVKVGDTWTQEISYVPGKVTADANQSSDPGFTRVLMTYKLDSIKKKGNRELAYISAKFETDIDAAPMYKEHGFFFEIKKMNAHVSGELTYVVDKKTCVMVALSGKSMGNAENSFYYPDPTQESGKYLIKREIAIEVEVSGKELQSK